VRVLFIPAYALVQRLLAARRSLGLEKMLRELDGFDVIVFLHIDPIIRLERLEKREIARFGQIDPEFLAWAARYDTGPTDMRSLAMHREWLAQRDCRVIRLVGDMSVEERVARVLEGI
jgi:hypothetical protein